MVKKTCILLLAAAMLAPSFPGAAPVAAPVTDSAADMHDLSEEREAYYTRSVRQWLDSLPAAQQEQARKILREAHPGLHALRVRIREKKAQLAGLSFDSATPPATLSRIGQEIQALRVQLRQRLSHINELLHNEAGIQMGPLGEEGFWLNPPLDEQTSAPRAAAKKAPVQR